ncbi:MAG TPA: protein kinase [Blastocatellia bacterium]|nr:protein kinase [Blastocatellia bacterium]
MMTPEFYERVCQICYDALQHEAQVRSGFLDRACAGDASLRKEVETMLAHEGSVENFLATPALIVAASQLAEAMEVENANLHDGARRMNGASILSDRLGALGESFEPGLMLGGRYLIDKELGRGGVCAVFLARDQKLHNAPVVIKVLLNAWREDSRKTWMEKKFKEEIAALARIDHPGVVRALDVGESPDGRSYLVMQYVAGFSLRSVMTPEGMELDRIARLARQMGRALAAAHRQGVIHRDLKPENIMLQSVGDEEYVKIIDFGIATIHDMADADDSRTTEVIGTRTYMAPEQLRGKPVAASDIYALGVIFYEMATGRRPFNAESILLLYDLQGVGVKLKPRDLRHSLPEAAQSLILKALSFAPRDRFANAKDFTDALADELMGEGGRLSPPRAFVGPRRWSLILVLALVAAIGVIALSLFSFRNTAGLEQAQITPVAAPDRYISYSLEARRDPSRNPRAKPFATFDNMIFGPGDEARLFISSPQSGFLYVINQGPTQTDGFPNFNILFPELENSGASSEIRAGQVVQVPPPGRNQQDNWFVFDKEEGVEYIWLVWSERVVPELEAVKGRANPKDQGAISDLTQRVSVFRYLTPFLAIKPEDERVEAGKQMKLKAKGETLVWAMKLEHR